MIQENQKRKFGSTDHYHWHKLRGKWYAFTDAQLQVARTRAKDNPEDRPTIWRRFFNLFK